MKRTTVVLLALLTAAPVQARITIDQPHIASKEVGPLLREAHKMIAAKNYKAALVKVNEAEAVQATPDDAYVINQFRQAIAAASVDRTKPTCTTPTGLTNCNGLPAVKSQH